MRRRQPSRRGLATSGHVDDSADASHHRADRSHRPVRPSTLPAPRTKEVVCMTQHPPWSAPPRPKAAGSASSPLDDVSAAVAWIGALNRLALGRKPGAPGWGPLIAGTCTRPGPTPRLPTTSRCPWRKRLGLVHTRLQSSENASRYALRTGSPRPWSTAELLRPAPVNMPYDAWPKSSTIASSDPGAGSRRPPPSLPPSAARRRHLAGGHPSVDVDAPSRKADFSASTPAMAATSRSSIWE